MDESTRRYYLDAMGIQCWQLIEQSIEKVQPEAQHSAQAVAETSVDYSTGTDAVPTSETGWSKIDGDINQCASCQLHKSRKQSLTGRGNQSAGIMFVMLSASPDDDETGILCSGESEILFSKMLTAINISLNDVYITSLLKCSVPLNHTVSPKEIQSCNKYLKQQIQLVKPKLLVILGEIAIQCLMQKNLSLDEYRDMYNGVAKNEAAQQLDSVPLFVSYSPQDLILNPDNKRKAWSDLQRLQELV
ncbi:MAG: uracil-DNA glycosylase [Proteobacteria bacterium]|nr:uracil-DNA glycosylase [Pseudomonadota bacterium]